MEKINNCVNYRRANVAGNAKNIRLKLNTDFSGGPLEF